MTGRVPPSAQLDREIDDFLDRETEDNIALGMPPRAARRAALVSFGNRAIVREDTSAVFRWLWLDQLRQDLAYAGRTLGRTPAFVLSVVLTLGIGIGVNTAIFSVFNAALLRTLPVPSPEELFLASVQAPVPV